MTARDDNPFDDDFDDMNNTSSEKNKQDIPKNFNDANPVVAEDHLLPPLDVKELHDQIDTLRKTLKEAQDKADAYWERLLRKEADLQNAQRRAQDDVEKARKFAIERFAGDLLQVLDSLDQGMNYAQDGQEHTLKEILEGMKMTHSMLMNIFDKQNIQVISPQIGEPFNPNFHEAITVQPTSEYKPNSIVNVIQKGYMLNERLLRPARVIVAKAP